MLLNILCVLLCGILIGMIIGFILARTVIAKTVLEIEKHWKEKLTKVNIMWSDFHRVETTRWIEKTNILINKAYFDATQERDKLWKQKFSGVKSKPKISN